MTLDVVLVNAGNRHAVYQELADDFGAIEPPSLAALFATYLRGRGQSVQIIDAAAESLSPEDVAKLVTEDYRPLLTCIVVYGFQPSASTQNMPAAGDTARAIKRLDPRARVMMTGTHPAALPKRTMIEEEVDFVCSAEGPRTISQVALFLQHGRTDFHLIADLYYRQGNVVAWGAKGSLIDDLDNLMPGGAWDLLPMGNYRAHNWHCFEHIDQRQPYVSIHTTMGCPYKCSFCCINAPFGGPNYRMWSPRRVGDELELLTTQYGIRNVKFVDEMFVLNRGHVNGVCDEITKRGLGDFLNIWAYARVDTVKDEYLDRLRAAGFRWLALGIESASKHVRDGVEKGRFGQEDILKVVRKVQAAGINVIGNYIFGLPDDTQETMADTLALALEANCEFANFYSAMAYPGSKLYDQAVAQGLSLPESWLGYSQHAYETHPLPTESLTCGDVLAFRDAAFTTYFTDPSYQEMVLRKFGPDVLLHVKRMAEKPLKRKLLGA